MPKLRERINDPHIEIYNLGVTGTSFEHFYRLLKDMKHEIKVTDIVILAISDDITRTLWHPFITNNRINFCFQTAAHSTCSDDINAARIIPYNSSNDEIIRLSREVMKERNYRLKVELDFSSYLLSRSHLLYHLRSITDPHIHAINPDYVNGLMDTLRNIQAEFPFIPIKVIHLPEKYEVKTHRYRIVDLGKALEGIGVEYYPALGKCSWSDDMFFQMDAHPNAKGYDAISNCVSSYLFGR